MSAMKDLFLAIWSIQITLPDIGSFTFGSFIVFDCLIGIAAWLIYGLAGRKGEE